MNKKSYVSLSIFFAAVLYTVIVLYFVIGESLSGYFTSEFLLPFMFYISIVISFGLMLIRIVLGYILLIISCLGFTINIFFIYGIKDIFIINVFVVPYLIASSLIFLTEQKRNNSKVV